MNDLRIVHHCLDDKESDFKLLAMLSLKAFFDSRIIFVTVFLKCLNLAQCIWRLVRLALRYALFRFRIIFLIAVVSHGGSEGLNVTTLLGTQVSVNTFKVSMMFVHKH